MLIHVLYDSRHSGGGGGGGGGDAGRAKGSKADAAATIIAEQGGVGGAAASDDIGSFRGSLHNFLHAHTAAGQAFEYFIFFLIAATTLSFMVETTQVRLMLPAGPCISNRTQATVVYTTYIKPYSS